LLQIDLLQSSGSAALDRAAVDTVEKLAPFAPFPEALARERAQLDIVRTWQFRR
jgi:protein TonB